MLPIFVSHPRSLGGYCTR